MASVLNEIDGCFKNMFNHKKSILQNTRASFTGGTVQVS